MLPNKNWGLAPYQYVFLILSILFKKKSVYTLKELTKAFEINIKKYRKWLRTVVISDEDKYILKSYLSNKLAKLLLLLYKEQAKKYISYRKSANPPLKLSPPVHKYILHKGVIFPEIFAEDKDAEEVTYSYE